MNKEVNGKLPEGLGLTTDAQYGVDMDECVQKGCDRVEAEEEARKTAKAQFDVAAKACYGTWGLGLMEYGI